MRIGILLIASVATALLAHAVRGQASVQIPRIDNITVDADPGDWHDGGLRINALAPTDGKILAPAEFDASIRLGWNDKGLLLFANITTAREDPNDSIDVIFGEPGNDRPTHRLIRGDDKHTVIKNNPTGFAIEALIPRPESRVTALQLIVNTTGHRHVWNAHALTFAQNPSPPITTALICLPQRLRRQQITVLTDASALDKRIEVSTGPSLKEIAATNAAQLPLAVDTVRTINGRPGAYLTVPLRPLGKPDAPLNIYIDSQLAGSIMPIDIDALRRHALAQIDVKFKPGVFTGGEFPRCDFADPAYARDLIGCPYTSKATFYNPDRQVVEKPDKPGRYGAVVTITTESGMTLPPRLVTLFRPRDSDGWRENDLDLHTALPAQLGIDPQVVRQQQPALAEHLSERFFDGLSTEPDAPLLLAALFDARPDGPLLAGRHSIWATDQRWWYPIKRQLGLDRYQYLVDLPPGYDKGDDHYPLLLFLHGSGECGDDVNQVRLHGPPKTFPANNPGFILVAPQCPSGQWWCAEQLKTLLDQVQRKYRVDPDRVCITGLSMGGYGAWELAAEYPDRFAAVAVCCGAGSPQDADRLKGLPAWIFHGRKDTVVPFARARQMADALKQAGGVVRFTPYPDLGHDCWTTTYADPGLYEWLLRQKRGAGSPGI